MSSIVALTTSLDGKFKTWVLMGGEDEQTKGVEEEEGKMALWACKSVGYHQNLPCMNGTFSQDGSLLAVNFSKVTDKQAPWKQHALDLATLLCLLLIHPFSGAHCLGAVLL